ncbi:MAG: hypothetical protein K8R02_10015 [Anaerohalosphaeraceae bacterium]|nr:hypothetical protein [Anaerohalosphaeraceae bacterium]
MPANKLNDTILDQIKLYTIHSQDFSLTDRPVDHNKSRYYRETAGVPEAYHKLWHKLGIIDGQIVWCHTCEDNIVREGDSIVKYELCVPKSKIICFIDDIVWNRILGIGGIFSEKMRNECFQEWKNNPSGLNLRDYQKKYEENFWKQEPKSGDWWDELFVSEVAGSMAIIEHPIPCEWIMYRG